MIHDAAISAQADAAVPARCIQSRQSLTVGAARPEIEIHAPSIRSVKKLAPNGVVGPVLVTRESVGVVNGTGLAILNKASGEVRGFSSSGGEVFQHALVTEEGDFLLAGRNAYAIDGNGKTRWTVALGGPPPSTSEFSACQIAYSNRQRLLVALCNNGVISGVRNTDVASAIWQRPLPMDIASRIELSPGAGDAPLVRFPAGRDQVAGTWAIDPASGQRLGVVLPSDDGARAFSSHGFLARSYDFASTGLVDECGQRRWTLVVNEGSRIPIVVGLPDERVFSALLSAEGTTQLEMRSIIDGQLLAGPVGTGTPIAAGADGTFYALTCVSLGFSSAADTAAPELVAYTAALEEKWRISLPIPPELGRYRCPNGGVALDEDGVLYLAVDTGGTMLISVQTRSPGLAPTSWPLRFGSKNGSFWLD